MPAVTPRVRTSRRMIIIVIVIVIVVVIVTVTVITRQSPVSDERAPAPLPAPLSEQGLPTVGRTAVPLRAIARRQGRPVLLPVPRTEQRMACWRYGTREAIEMRP